MTPMPFESCTIYTSTSVPNCPYCEKAKALLKEFDIPYTEVVIGLDLTKAEFHEQYGPDVKTVPQLVVNGVRIGGYESLREKLGR